MDIRKLVVATAVTAIVVLSPPAAVADRSKAFGDYTVHYNVVNTSFISPAVAQSYDIVRSKKRALLNISVQKQNVRGGTPVTARIRAVGVNLTQQQKNIAMREVREGDAIYYIGTLFIANEEVIDFSVQIRPEGEAAPLELKFRQQFFEQ